jgi:hypothetical protein
VKFRSLDIEKKWLRLVNPYLLCDINSGRTKNYCKLVEIMKFYKIEVNADDSVLVLKEAGEASGVSGVSGVSAERSEFQDAFPEGVDLNVQSDLESLSFLGGVPRCKLVIANAAFETEHDRLNQEQLIFKMLYTQTLAALMGLSTGGTLIMKLYDTYTRPTSQLIYLIACSFKHVSLIKPRTCSPTKSERYLVARSLKNADTIVKMGEILATWNESDYCRSLNVGVPDDFKNQLKEFNDKMVELETTHINKAIEYSTVEPNEAEVEAYQNIKANEFCYNFDISDSDVSCKHFKKLKISDKIKGTTVCERCLGLLI